MATNSPRSQGRSNNILDALQLGERPFGVTLLALWSAFLGGVYLLALLASLFLLQLVASLLQGVTSFAPSISGSGSIPGYPSVSPSVPTLMSFSTGTVLLYLLYITFLALSHLVVARGLFLLQQWAWWALVVVEACAVVIALIGFSNSSNSIALITGAYLPALTLLYLLAVPGVRRAFRVPF